MPLRTREFGSNRSAVNQKSQISTPERPRYQSYSDIVWKQFQKYRVSYVCLWMLLALFITAVVAPIISMNVPFCLYLPEGVGPAQHSGWSFPWFASLFDLNLFENGLDLFFNTMIFSLPLNALIWQLVRRSLGAQSKRVKDLRNPFLVGSVLAQLVLGGIVYLIDFRQPYFDYAALASLEGAKSLFPFFEFSYRDIDLSAVQLSPSWDHLLGTDAEGRDVFTRLLYGTRISLTIGFVAVGISCGIGVFLGSLAGYFGGKVDSVILRIIEVMMCFPAFFLILTLRGFIDDPSIFHVMIIIGVTSWTGFARLVRGEFLRLRSLDFVQAAIAMGLRQRVVIFRHVLPNAIGPVLVAATFGVAGAILIEAALSFLGLGPPTAPSWGQILTAGRETKQMPLILAPGFAIFFTVSLLNLVGEGVRDALDPKLRK
jgi:peptide/nickel transport system permease protein